MLLVVLYPSIVLSTGVLGILFAGLSIHSRSQRSSADEFANNLIVTPRRKIFVNETNNEL